MLDQMWLDPMDDQIVPLEASARQHVSLILNSPSGPLRGDLGLYLLEPARMKQPRVSALRRPALSY